MYVARYEKAHKFALAFHRHGGETGGMLEVVISFRVPKYASYEDNEWQDQGYDACRADETAASTAASSKCPCSSSSERPLTALEARCLLNTSLWVRKEPLPPGCWREAAEALWCLPKVANSTAFDRLGTNMEWCVRSADQVRVVRIWEVDASDSDDDYDSDDDDADEGELQEHSGW